MQSFRQWIEAKETQEIGIEPTVEPMPTDPNLPEFPQIQEPVKNPTFVSPRIILYQTVKNLLENIDIKQMGSKSKSTKAVSIFKREVSKFNTANNDLVDNKHDAGLVMKKVLNYISASSQQATEIASLQMVFIASIIDGTLRSIIKSFLKSIANFIPEKALDEEKTENWSVRDLNEYYTFLRHLVGESLQIDSEISRMRTYAPDMLNTFYQQVNDLGGSSEFNSHIHDYDPSTDAPGMQKELLKLALFRMYKSIGSIEESETNAFMKFQVLMIALTARPVMASRLNNALHQLHHQVSNTLDALEPISPI